jgi:hypothetical protein
MPLDGDTDDASCLSDFSIIKSLYETSFFLRGLEFSSSARLLLSLRTTTTLT